MGKHILRKANRVRNIAKVGIEWAIENDRFHGTIDGVSKEGDLTSCITATGHWIDQQNERKSMILETHAFKDLAIDEELMKGLDAEKALENHPDEEESWSESDGNDDE